MSLPTLKKDYELLKQLIDDAIARDTDVFYYKGKYLLLDHAKLIYRNYEKNIKWSKK